MKLLLMCLVIAVFSTTSADKSNMQLLKRLLKAVEAVNVRRVDSEKRYLYQFGHHPAPFVDKSKPNKMWVDLQMDEAVITACPSCRLFIAFQCVGGNCHNTNERRFPPDGLDWKSFTKLLASPGHYDGLWIPGLEGGRKYQVWDLVTLADGQTPYQGYRNDDRNVVRIPQ